MGSQDFFGRRRWLALPVALTLGLTPSAALVGAAPGVHAVQQGETLSEIAEGYGLPVAELAAINGISDPDQILAGSVLRLAFPGEAATVWAATGIGYQVGEGDTLDAIASAYGTTTTDLLLANPELTDPDLLVPGQVLRLPGAPNAVAALLATIATEYGIDPILLQALAWQESGWQQGVSSDAGAVGVMQVLPETGAWVASDLVGAPLDTAASAADNITAGAALLAWLIEQTGDVDLALACYVQGQGSVASSGVFPETWQYIANVRAIEDYLAQYGEPPR